MPRLPNETSVQLRDLQARLARLVEMARREGREDAFGQIRTLVDGGTPRRGPGRPPKAAAPAAPKPRRKRRKNPWAGLSPAAKLARVNAIRKGRGLPPKERL